MSRFLLVLGVLLPLLGSLSTNNEKDATVVKVESENDDVEAISTQSHLESDRKKGKKGKKPSKRPGKPTKPKPPKAESTKGTSTLSPTTSNLTKPKPTEPTTTTPTTTTTTPGSTKPTKPTTTPSPTIPELESQDDMLEQLELSSGFSKTNMTYEDQENCTKELKVAIKNCEDNEETIEKLRFKKPFIRSTELTDRLGRDSRLFNALKETIKRVSPDWTSSEGGESLIEFFSQNFQKWGEKGGGLSILEAEPSSRKMSEDVTRTKTEGGAVTCDANQQFRRIDGKCNNLANKHQGSAGTALRRFLPSRYEDVCPEGWKMFGGSCYLLLPQPVPNYDSAEKICKDKGADLISLETKDENDFVAKMLDEARDEGTLEAGHANGYSSVDIWLSIRRSSFESALTWTTGAPLVYTNWGFPEDECSEYTTVNCIYSCTQMVRNNGQSWVWFATRCVEQTENAVVCEKKQLEESTPRGGFPTSSLPSARLVSREIHHRSNPNPLSSKGITHMVMQFGQFLDHDLSLTADKEIDCCDSEVSNNGRICFNIDIAGDDFYEPKGRTCHSFSRSEEIVTDTEVREQINGITAYIDASNVYGSDDGHARNLRTLMDGKLKTHPDGPTLPTRQQTNLESHPPAQLDSDLVAGDVRAIEQPTLASLHSLFLNEHNRIADELRARKSDVLSFLCKSEQDELLYQETRKLVGAEMQNIVYNEFLPIVLGQEQLNNHKLNLNEVSRYDDKIDASIRNEFATVAFRFGHSLIAGIFNVNNRRNLRNSFFNEVPKFVSGGDGTAWHSELEECARQPSPAEDVFCTEDVTNFLFSNTRGASSKFGDDLPARNIQRGRDHGLPPYNEFRTFCGLNTLENFDTNPDEITAEDWEKLKNTYVDVNDIDAWTGGLAETTPTDGHVGPTFACIIGKQFNALKEGDRFFFNNDNGYGLKVNSRKTIRQRTLGDIMCDNTNTITLPRNVMKEEHADDNPQQNCSSRNGLDFDAIAGDIIVNEFIDNLVRNVTELVNKVTELEANKCDAATCSNILTSITQLGCSAGEMYNGNCYLLISTPANWTDAKQDCTRRNGRLASIDNVGANNFIANLSGGGNSQTWIGASDSETEGVWRWTNGDISTFTNWYEGEPNNLTGKQDCAKINYKETGKWDDNDCELLYPYVCEGNKLNN